VLKKWIALVVAAGLLIVVVTTLLLYRGFRREEQYFRGKKVHRVVERYALFNPPPIPDGVADEYYAYTTPSGREIKHGPFRF